MTFSKFRPNNKHLSRYLACAFLLTAPVGCLVAAGAVGAEAGYIASQEDRSAGQTIDDQVILASIKSQLLADPDVSGLNINVDVFKGTVQLRGYVTTQREIDQAISIAQKADGVKSVESKLVLDN